MFITNGTGIGSTDPCSFTVQADATYLIVNENAAIEKYGLNAVCTHLGCVVPWNPVSFHPPDLCPNLHVIPG